MNKPFLALKGVTKEEADIVVLSIHRNFVFAQAAIVKKKDETWSIYCQGKNNYKLKDQEVKLHAKNCLEEIRRPNSDVKHFGNRRTLLMPDAEM